MKRSSKRRLNSVSKYKIKQITSIYQSCNQCGLPIINCICGIVPQIKTNTKIWILSTEKEFYRPSNTARLMKLVNPDSRGHKILFLDSI